MLSIVLVYIIGEWRVFFLNKLDANKKIKWLKKYHYIIIDVQRSIYISCEGRQQPSMQKIIRVMETNSDIIQNIKANQEKFNKYNEIKLKNLLRVVAEQQLLNLVEFIPYLLNVNTPDLPGYIPTENIPHGVYDYSPSPRLIEFITRRFPNIEIIRDKIKNPFIQMIALIGSCGSIAFTKQSDFDYWLCYQEGGYDREAINHFRNKLRIVENWIYDKFNIEVHFYLNEINRVRNNIFADDNEQLSGSSIGELLKEEFLRSSIVLTGKIPFWWVVPYDSDDQAYNTWLAAVKGTYIANQFIDLGNIYSIMQEDFLPAGLFQILKSLSNPFKSIIKLGLLARYINNYMDNPFICNIIKKNIHQDKLSYHDIDAYIIMFDYVYDYYNSIVKEQDALEVLKTAFYLKVEPKLSRLASNKSEEGYDAEKGRVMIEYVKKWSWTGAKIKELDDFHNWGIEPVSKLLNNAKKFILQEYRRILGNLETHKIKHKFTDEEIKGISRKIYSHFSIADNKIDNTLTFKNYPPEKLLKIEYVRDQKGREIWFLSKRLIIDNQPNKIILQKDKTLLGLAVWISLNGLFKKDYTRLEIDPGLHNLEANFLRELITEISSNFMFKKVSIFQEEYLKDPYPVMSYIILNLYSKYSRKIDEVFFLYHDSWGSTRFESFNNEMDLIQILVRILNGSLVTRSDFEGVVNIISSSPFNTTKDFVRLKSTIMDLFAFIMHSDPNAKKSYVTMMGNQYLVFSTKKAGTSAVINTMLNDSDAKMLYNLSFNYGQNSMIRADPTVKELGFLKTILDNYEPNCIQIYFDSDKKFSYFYVLDETGSLFYYRKPAALLFEYLARLHIFAQNVAANIIKQYPESALAYTRPEKIIEIFQMNKDQYQNYSVQRIDPEHSIRMEDVLRKSVPSNLAVTIENNREIYYSITLPDGKYSERFSKMNIGVFVKKLKLASQSVKDYRYYITGTDLSKLQHRYFKFYSSYSFFEKIRVELMIESELKKLANA